MFMSIELRVPLLDESVFSHGVNLAQFFNTAVFIKKSVKKNIVFFTKRSCRSPKNRIQSTSRWFDNITWFLVILKELEVLSKILDLKSIEDTVGDHFQGKETIHIKFGSYFIS